MREMRDVFCFERSPIGIIVLIFFGIAFSFSILSRGEQQFIELAQGFLHGQFSFLDVPRTFTDTVFFEGKYYSAFGPFPAVVLMPFVFFFQLFSLSFFQGYLQFFLTAWTFFLCFALARYYQYSVRDAFFLALAFIFASVYQIVAYFPWSWYFAHAVAVLLVFLALAEFFGKRRYWLVGLLFAGVFMTRFTAGFGFLFFLAAILFEGRISARTKVRQCVALLLPILVAGLLLIGYNYARFGSASDNGYVSVNNWILSESERFETINYGLFQLRNIPTNIYYYFIKSLDPILVPFITESGRQTYMLQPPYITVSYPGVSFFIVSPIFLYLFRARFRERIVAYALIPTWVILFFLLTYYWPGWRQVGPRYLLDLLPFAYLILLYALRGQLSRFARMLIIGSAILDLYLFFQVI